ncbi:MULTISPECIES: DUF6241 domain-containing protein [Neobacillus]|jgi:hypothetical protein|uniref:DUF6241 domain-containing protein n=1 Tax=Neobacillus sedimentimangrovi TaxID=2699460 RepID=A0ABS8QE97_9BACI|nr:DUF6241 domain-containing protein [Neobacillus sedimentimangrovi]AIM16987.1 hypothetical protein HW35_12675 [Bacillus sp. X1(2014)]MCD4837577.1 DUF6241 domain-containing protein [Neobacillus sedimentimangrovi]
MKKYVIWSVSILAACAIIFLATMKIIDNVKEFKKKEVKIEKAVSQEEKKEKEKEHEEQTGYIGGENELGLKPDSAEVTVVDVMHKMTHQKVRADDKWGAYPMTPENIEIVYHIVSNSSFKIKGDLLEIVTRWKNGDFSKADEDHNYLWRYQGGNVGEAHGLMSPEEEAEFIKNNFQK